uniref:Uncharacterized protein n=1 Tax=Arundo donax TaxID=35708 RepID=A0A0A9GNM0_ARUDO
MDAARARSMSACSARDTGFRWSRSNRIDLMSRAAAGAGAAVNTANTAAASSSVRRRPAIRGEGAACGVAPRYQSRPPTNATQMGAGDRQGRRTAQMPATAAAPMRASPLAPRRSGNTLLLLLP